MTWEEFIYGATQYHIKHPHQREGQAYFNYLHIVNPELSYLIPGTDNDPFYDNSRINNLLEFLKDKKI